MKTLRFLFGFSKRVTRKEYLFWGVFLVILKFSFEYFVLKLSNGHSLTVFEFLSPTMDSKHKIYVVPGAALWPLQLTYLFSLICLWIGLSMTARRAWDAGESPWWLLGFFIPYGNLILMLALCLIPSQELNLKQENEYSKKASLPLRVTIASLMGIALLGTLCVAAIVFGVKSYGTTLFLATPFAMGGAAGFYLNKRNALSKRETLSLTFGTILFWCGFILLFAVEGMVCLLMAAPLVIVSAFMGALVGRKYAQNYYQGSRFSALAIMPVLLLMSSVESNLTPELRGEVQSSVVIDASPEIVWKNVVEFPKLEEPEELIFKAGVSYPIRARIEGSGVGAIRYCEFNSGAFVEPITRWEAPTRLSFDVAFQPRPMKELSPWESIEAPHLDGFFISQKGEFRLVALPHGKTRLEGSTWYALNIFPSSYWQLYSEWIVHKIHLRVLEHIKANSEKSSS